MTSCLGKRNFCVLARRSSEIVSTFLHDGTMNSSKGGVATTLKNLERRQHSTQFVPKVGITRASDEEISRLEEFIFNSRRLFIITGAGVSTESGIRDYRSEGIGLYEVSDQRPILHDDFLKKPARRHKYWARNFAGWPIFSSKQPNQTHKRLAKMEQDGKMHWLVTQNVDGLHQKAGSVDVTELHGTSSR